VENVQFAGGEVTLECGGEKGKSNMMAFMKGESIV
jgi:hypothetical protein